MINIKHLISIVFLCVSSTAVASQSLPPCSTDICTQVSHNKSLGKLSVLIWDNEGQILNSNEFELDKSAKLSYTSDANDTAKSNRAPSAPCATGGCSRSSSTTYVTATEMVTVTITYVYYNGVLVDINTSEQRTPLPVDDNEAERNTDD